MRRNRQQGVALVITLILLSVITLTAITFLILSRREKGAVATSTDQTIAKLAADTGLDRAQAEIFSGIITTTNQFGYDLKVTTNFYNPLGFQPGNAALTNVNYEYRDDGSFLNSGDQEENIANLFYNPRPPVYIFTNRAEPTNADFRFYLDLNRNGRYDTNGLIIEVDNTGQAVLDANLNPITNNVVGDPEWIGVLERPDEPHGPDNRFVARYATVVVPSGKTLDLNRIHNQVLAVDADQRDYRRNMGVGTWEINLAAFLVDLNTNAWTAPDDPTRLNPYLYDPPYLNPRPNSGFAFQDADALISYRYDTDFTQLRSVDELFGAAIGGAAFRSDYIDGYGGGGPFLTNVLPSVDDPDSLRALQTSVKWPGDDNPQQYFSPADLFDINKTAIGASDAEIAAGLTFPGRLLDAGLRDSTYNRYTFYRLLSQLGTDGGVERTDKVNINYDNRTPYLNGFPDPDGFASATNFVEWSPANFFVAAADSLLREYHRGHFRRVFGRDFVNDPNNNFARNIPVTTNGVLAYTPSINRALQLAANMYDATISRVTNGSPDFPSVFRPTFGRPPTTNAPAGVYITGWIEVTDRNAIANWRDRPLDLLNPVDAGRIFARGGVENVYGVPWIIGAKKGLPNFNELAVETIFEISRKLKLSRANSRNRPSTTNQMHLIAISSDVGIEAWNSYRQDFNRRVTIHATNQLDVMVYLTNQPTGDWTANGWRNQPVGTRVPLAAWPGTGWGGIPQGAPPNEQSFQTILRTNITVITNAIFRGDDGQLAVDLTPAYQGSVDNEFPVPDINLSFTNRLQFVMVDDLTGRVLDYVHLRLGGRTNLTQILSQASGRDPRFNLDSERTRLWRTNRVRGAGPTAIGVPTEGVLRQILVSAGLQSVSPGDWRDYGVGNAAGNTRQKEQSKFRDFIFGRGTNLLMQAPFTPSRRISQYLSWQANDPLVHYTDGDLQRLDIGDGIKDLPLTVAPQTLENIGQLNQRYSPWGGNPRSGSQTGRAARRNYDLRFKDSLVRSSDNWQFPTNKLPNVGWLGRVHRGTPWQTIYMKSAEIPTSRSRSGGAGRAWREWTGNKNRQDAARTFPQEDWQLFDLFTTAFNENATAGQLSVNQEGLAAWSAVLSGVIALTNTTPDADFQNNPAAVVTSQPLVIAPAGVAGTNSPVARIVEGINSDRSRRAQGGVFKTVGEVLQAEELTVRSPFLNFSGTQRRNGITDPMYERIPQQIMGLLRGDEQPRYVVYSYGQALKPAERSLVTSGPFFGMCTNYQITAESATRAVVRVDGAPGNPRVVLESFNVLPPD